ncbi:DNA cytosine methyltransferase [Billgrantia azerbaijanica]|nr:DNA cytosine methyltransferase [Halomonas azerbaijanica]
MRYGSVCSGIEAASAAWGPLGWQPAWFSEIEPFPSAVLAHHWPHVPNLGDMTKLARRVLLGEVFAPDVFVGGTPCQAFSVAGMREGLSDERGQLTMKYVELADAIDLVRSRAGDPEAVIVWENVPGALSDKSNAFGCFLGALAGEDRELQPSGKRWTNAGCVYGPQRAIAWRVLDAQYFGVAQRRRRVFVVAGARAGFDPAAVLFESEGVRRDTPPRREAREDTAADAAPGVDVRNGTITGEVAHTIQAGQHAPDPGGTPHAIAVTGDITHALNTANNGKGCSEVRQVGGDGQVTGAIAASPGVQQQHYVAQAVGFNARQDTDHWNERTGPLDTDGSTQAVHQGLAVRRLTPLECERLQGFPDNWTSVPYRGKPAADSPRYKAIGNSMAVPVMVWLGERIAAVDAVKSAEEDT